MWTSSIYHYLPENLQSSLPPSAASTAVLQGCVLQRRFLIWKHKVLAPQVCYQRYAVSCGFEKCAHVSGLVRIHTGLRLACNGLWNHPRPPCSRFDKQASSNGTETSKFNDTLVLVCLQFLGAFILGYAQCTLLWHLLHFFFNASMVKLVRFMNLKCPLFSSWFCLLASLQIVTVLWVSVAIHNSAHRVRWGRLVSICCSVQQITNCSV